MRSTILIMIAILICGCASKDKIEGNTMTNPKVTIKTNQGNVTVELHQNKVPDTVNNFLSYVDAKHYDNTIFHRVIDNFMIQGGGFTTEFKEKSTKDPIKNEANKGSKNTKGTLAMARTSDVHSATAQFFINVADNSFLDFQNPTPHGYGYCVFGEVTEGMDVVEKIKSATTGNKNGHQDVPTETITIFEIVRN